MTKNNISKEIKTQIDSELNFILADLINLGLITKHAHWNLKGINFISIHEMLDDFKQKLDEHIDVIAERIVQVGKTAFGTLETVQKNSSLTQYDPSIIKTIDHLNALVEYYAIVANKVRDLILVIEDENTADILTAASRDLDQMLWFLEAHI